MAVKPVLFVPDGLNAMKQDLFGRMARRIGASVRGDASVLNRLNTDCIPIVCCKPGVGEIVRRWQAEGRPFIYWDRGYFGRGGKTWLGRSLGFDGHWRFCRDATQHTTIQERAPDRWRALGIRLQPWRRIGRHIVVAAMSETYDEFHGTAGWVAQTVAEIRRHTGRPIVVRQKNSGTPLGVEISGAHCLVTHGSIAAVEAAIMGCPVFVDRSSAAAPIGETDMTKIETPAYPDREPWAWSLACSQFTEAEILDGTMLREVMP